MKSIMLMLVIALSACQTVPYQPYAREIKRKPKQNGIIALKLEHKNEDTAMAHELMTSNCSDKSVNILEEGEVVVGEKTTAKSDQNFDSGAQKEKVGSLFGIPLMAGRDPSSQTTSESSKLQLKEWQISYECEVVKKR